MYISEKTVQSVIKKLAEQYPEQKTRIEKGVRQTAAFWRFGDGSARAFTTFCTDNFIGDQNQLKQTRKALEKKLEVLNGTLNRLSVDLKKPVHTDTGELSNLDIHFSMLDPFSHLEEDLYNNKTAFLVLLNFPHLTLEEKSAKGLECSNDEWSTIRTGDIFTSRVPGKTARDISGTATKAEAYIADYNIYMHNILDRDGYKLFPMDLKLISHWGLRDEIRARYKDPDGLKKQRLICTIMEKIIHQDIPQAVINSSEYEWAPEKDELYRDGKPVKIAKEADNRYKHFLNLFNAIKKSDEYYPGFPTHILRQFNIEREIPLAEVKQLFESVLTSDAVKKTAAHISSKLNRKLEPFDIWYNGFTGEDLLPAEELDNRVKERFPDIKSFRDQIDSVLRSFGFDKDQAQFIKDRIAVEPARGAGHAWGPEMIGEKAYLRTRVPEGSMDYKGFNTAMHELGHCVEQVISLYYVDHYNLHGIPNTAFTEAFAFLFQNRDLEILGLQNKDKQEFCLDTLWNAFEIMGVSMVDIEAWEWLYDNPEATAADLKEAVISIAKDVWNRYFAELFNVKDCPLLGIYSHLIDCALYLPDYPLGFLIQFQIEEFMKGKNLGREMTRMCSIGRVPPQIWMEKAVNSRISAEPLLNSVEKYFSKTGR